MCLDYISLGLELNAENNQGFDQSGTLKFLIGLCVLSDFVQAGDRILLKASRAVGLDQVVDGLVKRLG